jgi:hypothetical protein
MKNQYPKKPSILNPITASYNDLKILTPHYWNYDLYERSTAKQLSSLRFLGFVMKIRRACGIMRSR